MNKKGFTVLELIVSFTLASIIGTFLLMISIVLKDLITDASIRSNIINSGAIITVRMQDDFLTKDARIALKCGNNCIRFIFADYSEKVFKIEDENTFKWGDYTLKLKNSSKFGNVKTEVDSLLEASRFDNSILTISIPVTNDVIEDEVFDVRIVIPYNNEILYINDNLDFSSANNEYYLGLNGAKTYILDAESIFSDPGSYVYYGEKTCTMVNNVNYDSIKNNPLKITNTFEGGGICSNLSVEINYEPLRVVNGKYVQGNYDITYDLKINGASTYQTVRHMIVIQKERRFNYTGGAQNFVASISGYYKLEAWGASGVNSQSSYGAYASSTVRLLKGEKLYVYVGQANNSLRGVPNFNTNYPSGYTFNGYSGGGATDIRTSTNLSDRILVAGGGGSGAKNDTSCGYGMNENEVSSSCISNGVTGVSTICGPGGGYNSINSSLFVDCNDTATGGTSYVKESFVLNGRTVVIVNDNVNYNKKIVNGKSPMVNPYTAQMESHGNAGNGFAIISYIGDVLE